MLINTQTNTFAIYREGKLDYWATHKHEVMPAVIGFLNRTDARISSFRATIDKTPIYAMKVAQALNRELDRQVGRV